MNFIIKDFEGDVKATDMLTKSGRMALRSGEDNLVAWKHTDQDFEYQFKLESAFQKEKAIAIEDGLFSTADLFQTTLQQGSVRND